MAKATFVAALALASDRGDYITLGGGEPTIHPQFWDFFGLALAKFHDEPGLHIVTNGKVTETALALAALARGGILSADLSQDQYHDRIAPEVVQAFTWNKRANPGYGSSQPYDLRGTRSADGRVFSAGRAKRNGLASDDRCFCDDIVIEPSGKLWACGCRRVSFGTVFRPRIQAAYSENDTRCFRLPEETAA